MGDGIGSTADRRFSTVKDRSSHIEAIVNLINDHFRFVFEFVVVAKVHLVSRKSYLLCARVKKWIAQGVETKIEFDVNLE